MAQRPQQPFEEGSGPDPWLHGADLTLVIAALRQLKDPPAISAEAANDPIALFDLLCDRAAEIAPDRLFDLIVRAVGLVTVDHAVSFVLENSYFLDATRVAECTLARLWTECRSGSRRRPAEEWLEDALAEVVRDGRDDPELSFHPIDESSRPGDRIAHAAGLIINYLPQPVRRIAWLAIIDRRDPYGIARETGAELERVEFIVQEIGDRALRAAGYGSAENDDEDRSPRGYDDDTSDSDDREFEEGTDG